MVDILVTANGYKAGDAIELITKPLEDIVKGDQRGRARLFEHPGRFRGHYRALFRRHRRRHRAPRVHEKIRANIADLPKGIPSR